ncbi:MAG: cysteine desulfurase NifS [Roseburia sp.]|nr:cysteine desulfurase NifS [Roseburia sp.]
MIYLDNAATTKIAPGALEAMLPCLREAYGNPGGKYRLGFEARKLVNTARDIIGESLGAVREEIYFTAGGSESDNWALKAAAEALRDKGGHIITTAIEHPAVLRTCRYLEKQGFSVTYLPVDEKGRVEPESVRRAIRPDTILISVMFANNEIGTIEPIGEIGAIAREREVLFHTDAVQAYGQLPIDVKALQIDMLSASAHKFNGPKGVGFLYVRSGVRLGALIHGGSQERGRRAGTENVPGIVGMGAAARLAAAGLSEKMKQEQELRDYLIGRLETEIPNCRLNGDRFRRLPGNVNVSFPGIEGESLLIMLDMEGICASSGSACTSGATEPSHVLTAIGLEPEEARGSLRLTLSRENTREEMDRTVEVIKGIVERLRSLREF